jgi:hypothetical protein
MNKACVIKAHGAGLFSNINKVITCMEMYEKVHVDWSNHDNIYRPLPDQDKNVWNCLFGNTNPPEEPHDVVIEYPHQDYTWKNVGKLYRSEDQSWRTRLNALWRTLSIQSDVMDRTMTFGGLTIGVLVRSKAIAGEQENNNNASIDSYIYEVRRVINEHESKHPRVFAVCSDEPSCRKMMKHFNAAVYQGSRRAESRDIDQHMEFRQNVNDAKNCLAEVISLSRCNILVHQISNMATAALYMNPNLKSVYLQ